jgi:hypothetical protein
VRFVLANSCNNISHRARLSQLCNTTCSMIRTLRQTYIQRRPIYYAQRNATGCCAYASARSVVTSPSSEVTWPWQQVRPPGVRAESKQHRSVHPKLKDIIESVRLTTDTVISVLKGHGRCSGHTGDRDAVDRYIEGKVTRRGKVSSRHIFCHQNAGTPEQATIPR